MPRDQVREFRLGFIEGHAHVVADPALAAGAVPQYRGVAWNGSVGTFRDVAVLNGIAQLGAIDAPSADPRLSDGYFDPDDGVNICALQQIDPSWIRSQRHTEIRVAPGTSIHAADMGGASLVIGGPVGNVDVQRVASVVLVATPTKDGATRSVVVKDVRRLRVEVTSGDIKITDTAQVELGVNWHDARPHAFNSAKVEITNSEFVTGGIESGELSIKGSMKVADLAAGRLAQVTVQSCEALSLETNGGPYKLNERPHFSVVGNVGYLWSLGNLDVSVVGRVATLLLGGNDTSSVDLRRAEISQAAFVINATQIKNGRMIAAPGYRPTVNVSDSMPLTLEGQWQVREDGVTDVFERRSAQLVANDEVHQRLQSLMPTRESAYDPGLGLDIGVVIRFGPKFLRSPR